MVNTMDSEMQIPGKEVSHPVADSENVSAEVHPLGGVMMEIWLEYGGFISLDYYAK